MKVEDLIEDDRVETVARELHDLEAATFGPIDGKPHPMWDGCHETHRERYRRIARGEKA